MYKAVVVIPVYRGDIDEYEKISFRQNISILRNYPVTIITHRSVDLSFFLEVSDSLDKPLLIEYLDETEFADIEAYNKLMISSHLYRLFKDYDYMLLCQLDCFVFEDSLMEWMEKDYSYIGAPWVERFQQDNLNAPVRGMGNGGLSLRKINHCLKVLTSFSYVRKPAQLKVDIFNTNNSFLIKVISLLHSLTISNNTFYLFNDWSFNEDLFWAKVADRNFSWFMVPDWREALGFSIEMQPRRFVQLNSNNLPFGCHAWWTYDLDFWRPHIENYGFDLDK